VEVVIRGTHLGGWRGLRRRGGEWSFRFAVCTPSTLRTASRGEKIYYDRGTVLRQLGVFHEPQSVLGQISTLVTHPLRLRALWRGSCCAGDGIHGNVRRK